MYVLHFIIVLVNFVVVSKKAEPILGFFCNSNAVESLLLTGDVVERERVGGDEVNHDEAVVIQWKANMAGTISVESQVIKVHGGFSVNVRYRRKTPSRRI